MPLQSNFNLVTPILTRYSLTGRRDADNAQAREINIDEGYSYGGLTQGAAISGAVWSTNAAGGSAARFQMSRIQSDDVTEVLRPTRGYSLERQIARAISWTVRDGTSTNLTTATSNVAGNSGFAFPFNVTISKSVAGTRYEIAYIYFDIRGQTAYALVGGGTANSYVVSIPGPVILLCYTRDLTGGTGEGAIAEYLYR